jgi:hypothetical protein
MTTAVFGTLEQWHWHGCHHDPMASYVGPARLGIDGARDSVRHCALVQVEKSITDRWCHLLPTSTDLLQQN